MFVLLLLFCFSNGLLLWCFLYHKWKHACGRMGKLRLFDEGIANEVE